MNINTKNKDYKNLYKKYKTKYLKLRANYMLEQNGGDNGESETYNELNESVNDEIKDVTDDQVSDKVADTVTDTVTDKQINRTETDKQTEQTNNDSYNLSNDISSETINRYLEKLNNMRNEMDYLINKIREVDPEFLSKNIYSWGNNINHPNFEFYNKLEKLQNVIEKFTNYMQQNDIPLTYNLDTFFTKELVEAIETMKGDFTFKNLSEKYKTRKYFYTLEEKNMNEILDAIILEFNINNVKDIEKIFRSTLFGYNKNYIIGYMVLFRYLIENKNQLSVIDNDISYLTFNSIYSSLNNSINSEEYIGLLVKLINLYIKSFPVKKVINIRNPVDFEKKYAPKTIVSFNELNEKIEIIDRYDVKNNVIIYKSGDIKNTAKANFDDIKQIIYTLFRIPVRSFDS